MGDDRWNSGARNTASIFQSTSPVWGTTTATIAISDTVTLFQSTSPVWGTTPCSLRDAEVYKFQSTSPVWGTTQAIPQCTLSRKFQSTSPVWGTTDYKTIQDRVRSHFNPRPPCGGRRKLGNGQYSLERISIHVPRVGDDSDTLWTCLTITTFQSTSPVWGTTTDLQTAFRCPYHFNPRPPCGGRPLLLGRMLSFLQFQSTSPVWGTTALLFLCGLYVLHFNPRPPCGGRHG